MAHPASYPTDQHTPRTGGFLCLGCIRSDEPRPRHGGECIGRSCPCTCRATLGLAGPFGHDPTAPSVAEQLWGVA